MIVAKQVADLITTLRALIAIFLIWLGETQGANSLPTAIWVMFADWVGDALDGPIARRSRKKYQTWIGEHDLEVDMTVSIGLLAYLLLAGYISAWATGGYILLWGGVFIVFRGFPRSYGMLFQTPIYGWFTYIAFRYAPGTAWVIPAFIVLVIALTWPRFPQTVIPGFLAGLQKKDEG